MSEYQLIADQPALEAYCKQVQTAERLAVDTEFMREKSYYPQLCLIQISDGNSIALIDPLAEDIDLAPLWALMHDPNILKLLHAAWQDCEIVFHETGTPPTPIFDTQVAAQVCGFGESIAYPKLAKALTGANIDKGAQFTDWARRPLSDSQLHYAAGDVAHLHQMHDGLMARLNEQGRANWVAEEMEAFSDAARYDKQPSDFYRKIRLRSNKPRDLARMQAMVGWREEQAKEKNVPRQWILKDDTIAELALNPVNSTEALFKLRSSPGRINKAQQKELVALLAEVAEWPKEKLPEVEKPEIRPQAPPGSAALLKTLLQALAEQAGVAAIMIASAKEVEQFASIAHIPEEAAKYRFMHGWRYDLYGHKAEQLLRGEVALTLDGPKGLKSVELDS